MPPSCTCNQFPTWACHRFPTSMYNHNVFYVSRLEVEHTRTTGRCLTVAPRTLVLPRHPRQSQYSEISVAKILVPPVRINNLSSIRGEAGLVVPPLSHSLNLVFFLRMLGNLACDWIQTLPFMSPHGVILISAMYAETDVRADSSLGMSLVRCRGAN
jgi:hypothetical protein